MFVSNFMSKTFSYQDLRRGGGEGGGALCTSPLGHDHTKIPWADSKILQHNDMLDLVFKSVYFFNMNPANVYLFKVNN